MTTERNMKSMIESVQTALDLMKSEPKTSDEWAAIKDALAAPCSFASAKEHRIKSMNQEREKAKARLDSAQRDYDAIVAESDNE